MEISHVEGTTAVIAGVANREQKKPSLIMSWSGDSRASKKYVKFRRKFIYIVLIRQEQVVMVTDDHNLKREDEYKRVIGI